MDGRFNTVNSSAARLSQYTQEELLQKVLATLRLQTI
ncbi:MAG: hypothetical protein HC847_11930 [Hydrococcus sp. RU_2_2]|nr:hypothetical protein [Hydrococcus sp. RU_2_2]